MRSTILLPLSIFVLLLISACSTIEEEPKEKLSNLENNYI